VEQFCGEIDEAVPAHGAGPGWRKIVDGLHEVRTGVAYVLRAVGVQPEGVGRAG